MCKLKCEPALLSRQKTELEKVRNLLCAKRFLVARNEVLYADLKCYRNYDLYITVQNHR
jgi:hypothetical protein